MNNQDNLEAVSVDFRNGPVEPSLDTITEDGDYAIYAMSNINSFAGFGNYEIHS